MSLNYLADGNEKTIELKGRKIVIKKFSYAQQKELTKLAEAGNQMESMDKFLLYSIASWDLVSASGDALPVNAETLNGLAGDFVTELIKFATALNVVTVDEVKN